MQSYWTLLLPSITVYSNSGLQLIELGKYIRLLRSVFKIRFFI